MRLIVWGTGKLYRKYKSFLSRFNIVKLCDNNPEKQGTYIDGIEVIDPSHLEDFQFNYVVVMAYSAEEICLQMKGMGIPEEKILLESQLCALRQPQICVHTLDAEISLDNWLKENRNSVLLISHNFSYTGIPVALKNMANVLKKMGYTVLMAAMEGGTFVQELEQQAINYIDDLEICYRTQYFQKVLDKFEAVVIGSFSLYNLGMSLENMETPILWWVHETLEKYYAKKEELPVKKNIKFLAGGNRVKKIFNKHYENTKIEKFQYCIPDFRENTAQNILKQDCSDCMIIAVIGTVDKRKAQDILLESIIKMPAAERNRLKVVLIGRLDENDTLFVKKIEEQKKQLDNLEWIEEMPQEALESFYEKIDVLVCPSRDDPMPIVVTQAMMHEKICVISEEVGQAEFIKQRENGFIFPNENADALMKILMWLLDNKDKRTMIGKNSRKIYDDEFSERVMEKRLGEILHETCTCDSKVEG